MNGLRRKLIMIIRACSLDQSVIMAGLESLIPCNQARSNCDFAAPIIGLVQRHGLARSSVINVQLEGDRSIIAWCIADPCLGHAHSVVDERHCRYVIQCGRACGLGRRCLAVVRYRLNGCIVHFRRCIRPQGIAVCAILVLGALELCLINVVPADCAVMECGDGVIGDLARPHAEAHRVGIAVQKLAQSRQVPRDGAIGR